MRIAILEDDLTQSEMLRWVLESVNHKCYTFATFKSFQTALYRDSFDLVLLDWVLPDSSGPKVMQWIRDTLHIKVPVLFITSKTDEENIVEALNAGADDYMIKPIRRGELIARVNALIRRSEGRLTIDPEGQAFLVDMDGSRIAWQGQWLELSQSEFRILTILLKNPERIFSRSLLLDQLGDNALETGERAIDSHIKNIRKKLASVREGGGRITSVYGAGYKFTPE